MIKEQIKNLISEKTARVGVIGLGYVGLPLIVEFGLKGFEGVGWLQSHPLGELDRLHDARKLGPGDHGVRRDRFSLLHQDVSLERQAARLSYRCARADGKTRRVG